MKKEYRGDEPFNTTFKTLSGFNALRNLKRLQQSMQNIPIVLTGERLKDSSLLVYLPSSKTVDSVSEMDFQIAIESALFFAQLISGQTQSSLQLSIFLDCSKETNKDIVKKFDIMSRYQPNLTSIYILEPDKSFGNIFGGDSRHLLNSLKLSKCNVHIADSSSFKRLNLEANIVPVKFGGNRTFNTTIWTRAFTVFSNYLSKLLELYSQFDEHLKELEKISNIEEPQDLINFLKQEKNKKNSMEISYKIKEMLRNRESVLLYFSRTDFMEESPMIFNLVASRIIGMCENLNLKHDELNQRSKNRLNELNDLKNLDEFLKIHCEIIADKTKKVFLHKYSITNLEFWLKKIDENIICEREILGKMRNELEMRESRSALDSENFVKRCKPIRRLMDAYSTTIDQQTESLHKQLLIVDRACDICMKHVECLDDLNKVENLGDFMALLNQDAIYLASILDDCSNILAKTIQLLRALLHKVQLVKRNERLYRMLERYEKSGNELEVKETNIVPSKRQIQLLDTKYDKMQSDNKKNGGNMPVQMLNEEKSEYDDDQSVDNEDNSACGDFSDDYSYTSSLLDELAEEARKDLKEQRQRKSGRKGASYHRDDDKRYNSGDFGNSLIDEGSQDENSLIFEDDIRNTKSQKQKRLNRKERTRGYHKNNPNKGRSQTRRGLPNYNQYNDGDIENKRIAKGLSKDGGTFVQQQIKMDGKGVQVINKKITRKGGMMITETERVTMKGKNSPNYNSSQSNSKGSIDTGNGRGMGALMSFINGMIGASNARNTSVPPQNVHGKDNISNSRGSGHEQPAVMELQSPAIPIIEENE